MAKLSKKEIQGKLKDLKDWQIKGRAIVKTFTLPSFKEAISFVTKVTDLAEAANHHPDMLIQYNKVTLTLSTGSEGGVTEHDINLATQIEKT
ncbi:MAG TPA: 4a-hydroxytetrahydrobiopterin dehydratase [Candidatus Brocadiaceae bacterium]|nr:4a-hydroxytetrahydrobiopterin dehydratase [Candidatus Brocadiaceae bacterium]